MSEKLQLIEFVRQVSRERELSRKTESAYVNHIRRFQEFYQGRDLAKVGANGIGEFLNHLRRAENLAVSTQNQALSAISFLYRDVFGQKTTHGVKIVKRAKPDAKTPVVFTDPEARAVLSRMRGDAFLAAALMYGSGLRLSEAVALRVGDIDFERREIIVRNGRTGRRERVTVLPEKIIPALKKHLVNVRYLHEDDCLLGGGSVRLPKPVERHNPNAAREWRWQFVFPSHNVTVGKNRHRHHMAESTVQKAVSEAVQRANIFKPACCQTFRYSFAARLFERNYDIHRIQTLLGHKNLKTTAVYQQLAAGPKNAVRSPLDN
jgi:integron integrase